MVKALLSLAGLCVVPGAAFSGENTGFRLPATLELESVVLPVYRDAETTPVAILRADRIYTEYERRGFYRIGVLPVAVMEGVRIELGRPDQAAESLRAVSRQVEEQFGDRFEIRGLKLQIAPAQAACLEAGRARAGRDGGLELLDGVRVFSGTNQFQADRALVQLTGPEAGRVILKATPGPGKTICLPFQNPEHRLDN